VQLHLLVSKELLACPAMDPPAKVVPEQRSRPHRERMEQHAHPTGLLRVLALPLALLPQATGATVADARRIHQTQTAIRFPALFGG
jgi:hypothetical protein